MFILFTFILLYHYAGLALLRSFVPSFLTKLNSFVPFVSFTDVVYIHHTKRTMATVCQICDYKMNLTTRKPIKCPYCDFETCRTCVETYVLGDTTIKCMSPQCNRQWTRQHIHSIFTATFIRGRLKSHREQLLFDNERALLPSTQPLVERDIRIDAITQEQAALTTQINRLYQQRVNLGYELRRISNGEVARAAEFVRECPSPDCRGFLSTQWKCGICNLWACPDCHEIKGDSRDTEHTCNPDILATARLLDSDTKPCPNCRTGIFKINGCFGVNTPIPLWDGTIKMSQNICLGDVLIGDDGEKRVVEQVFSGEDELYRVVQYGGKCYVVNSKHTLVLTSTTRQNAVFEIRIDDYIKMHDMLKQDLCGFTSDGKVLRIDVVPIGKGTYYGWTIDGNSRFILEDFTVLRNCDQMWCTQCHTAFNWRTGRIESVVHNPHYFEWLRRNGNAIPRNPGDIPCQNELTHTIYSDIRNRIRDHFPQHPLREHCDTYLSRTIRNILHMRHVTLNEYEIPNRAAINERLRVQYMRNRITEENFKITLQRTDKKIEKKRETRDIITLLLTTATDIILRFYAKLRDETNPELDGKILDELKPIVDYANECLMEISRVYNGKTIQYTYEFSIK